MDRTAYMKQYCLDHKDEIAKRNRKWYAKNKGKVKAYYKKNKKHIQAVNAMAKENNPEKFLFRLAKSRAKMRGMPFGISVSDVRIPKRCPALGIVLRFNQGVHGDNSPSLDAIVPSLGYVPGNVQVISYRANKCKSNASLRELSALVKWLRKAVRKAVRR